MTPMLYTLEEGRPPAFSYFESLPVRALRRASFALWVGSPEKMERCLAELPTGLSGILLVSGDAYSFSGLPSGLFLMTVPEPLIQELPLIMPGFLLLADELEKCEGSIRSQSLELNRSREDQVRLSREFAGFRESLIHEIAERKRTEEELKEHRDHLEELVRERTAELQEKNNQLVAEIAERKRMETELLHAQKMESIGHLAAGIAHEINTPIQFIGDNLRFLKTSVSDMLELINRYEPLKKALNTDCEALLEDIGRAEQDADLEYLREEMPKALDQSEEGVKRVSKIVLAMKEFSHPSSDDMTPTDINRAIETTATIARNEWKYVAELETCLDAALPLVPCLPGDINQVLLNLIVNAAHAIGEAFRRGEAIKGKITVSTRREGERVEIRVADNGPGIPEEYRRQIFTPFFTTKEVGKGTGQGLALCYNVVVKKHQGTIRFETEAGQGTVFIVRLPLSRPASSA